MRVLISSLISVLLLTSIGCVSAESRMQQGDAHFVSGHFSVALDQYHAARRKDPTLPGIDEKIRVAQVQLFLQQGDALVARGEWAAAERAYGEVGRLDPSNPDIAGRFERLVLARANEHFRCGTQLFAGGDPFAAIGEFEQCLIYQPDHPRAANALERARAAKRDREQKAESRFEEALQSRAAGLDEEAMRLFAEALELDPFHPSAERELRETRSRFVAVLLREGDDLAEQRKFVEAISVYRSVLEVDPTLPGVTERIHQAELEASAVVLFEEGGRAFDRGNWARAFEVFDEACRLTAEPERFRERLELSRDRYATEVYESAAGFRSAGRYRDALTEFRRIRQFHPEFRDVQELCERLSIDLPTAEGAYAAGCHAQELCDLVLADEQFRVCAGAIPRYRDVADRMRSVRDGLARAQDFYDRAVRGEARGDHQRARILFEECLTISNPFRDAVDRLARVDDRIFDDEVTISEYDDACRAQRGRDLERARRLYVVCDQSRPGYRDVAKRLRETETEMEVAREIYRRGVEAEKACDLPRARKFYQDCLAICDPCSDARPRLERIIVAERTLGEARDLKQERKLIAARDCYQRVIDQCGDVVEARDGIREIDANCAKLAGLHQQMIVAQEACRYRLALSFAVQIRKQCVGFRDVSVRVRLLESEADYADGCAFESQKRYDAAMRCFERCAERSPGHRDVDQRMERMRRMRR